MWSPIDEQGEVEARVRLFDFFLARNTEPLILNRLPIGYVMKTVLELSGF